MLPANLLFVAQRARDDDTDWGKIIGPLLFFLIWIIGAAVTTIQKQKEKKRQQRQRVLEQMPAEVRQKIEHQEEQRRQQLQKQRSSRAEDLRRKQREYEQRKQDQQRQQAEQKRLQEQFAKRRQLEERLKRQRQLSGGAPARQPLARPPVQAQPELVEQTEGPQGTGRLAQSVASTEIGREQQQPRLPRVTAKAISIWMRPQTLQQQFILTEILRPPLSMREEA